MHQRLFIVLLLALFTSIGHAQSDKIKIKSEHLNESNYLKADDFYLTHHLYIDLFLRENLFPEASTKDVSSIIKAIKKYVSVEKPLEIEIEKPGKTNYIIKVAILKTDDGNELLVVFTNWSPKKRIFEKEMKMENDSYTRWYMLNDNKMTYRKDMSNKNDYSNMDKTDIANAYLFDELTENDNKIKSTIDEILAESNLSVLDNITANLILLKYQLFQKDIKSAMQQAKYLNELFENHASEANIKGLRMAFYATQFQIELMK